VNEIQQRQTVSLLLFTLASFGLSYATALVFARTLGVQGYDDYAVAVSSAVRAS
jgi:hypothetical protein